MRAEPVGTADAGGPPLPWRAQAFPSVPEPLDNPTTQEKASLGRALFYDPVVSTDRQTACATCHSEEWGMGDGLPRSIGVGAGLLTGTGRRGSSVVRRNAQSLWNVAYRETLFWDGRSSSLEDQVHFPFDAAVELGRKLGDVMADLRAIPEYGRLFGHAFPDEAAPITIENFAKAIAAFERTLITNHSLYDSYVAGDTGALTDAPLRGMGIFAEAGCPTCHTPPLFSSERFGDRGVAPMAGVDDAGRFETTGIEQDRNRFKVPSLRNTHDTGPFFHTGGVAPLADAVRQEVGFSVAHGDARALDETELSDLTAFILEGLFDSSRSPLRPRKVPSGLPVPLDGFSLVR